MQVMGGRAGGSFLHKDWMSIIVVRKNGEISSERRVDDNLQEHRVIHLLELGVSHTWLLQGHGLRIIIGIVPSWMKFVMSSW